MLRQVISLNIKRWVFPFLIFLLAIILSMQVLAQTQEKTLAGKTFVIDSGHGGMDDGAQRYGVKEDDINLAIAKEVSRQLVAQGADVLMTRDGDYDLSDADDANHKQEDLKRRVAIINCGMADYFISIHLNAYTSSNVQGAQVFYQEDHCESEAIAKQIQEQLAVKTDSKMSAKIGNYYILEKPSIPGVLVECGFLSNEQEREQLQDEAYQKLLASAIVEGFIAYVKENP